MRCASGRGVPVGGGPRGVLFVLFGGLGLSASLSFFLGGCLVFWVFSSWVWLCYSDYKVFLLDISLLLFCIFF